MKKSPLEKFNSSYIPVTETGCWLWERGCNRAGYGYFSVNGKQTAAHRFSYETFRAPIPPTLTIDHLCRVRPCVNPDHLEPVPDKVNILRGDGQAARNIRKTHCNRGHQFDDDNTRIYRDGHRSCRACEKLRNPPTGRSVGG